MCLQGMAMLMTYDLLTALWKLANCVHSMQVGD